MLRSSLLMRGSLCKHIRMLSMLMRNGRRYNSARNKFSLNWKSLNWINLLVCYREDNKSAWLWLQCSLLIPTCSFSTNPPTIWIWRWLNGWRNICNATLKLSSWWRTIAIFSTVCVNLLWRLISKRHIVIREIMPTIWRNATNALRLPMLTLTKRAISIAKNSTGCADNRRHVVTRVVRARRLSTNSNNKRNDALRNALRDLMWRLDTLVLRFLRLNMCRKLLRMVSLFSKISTTISRALRKWGSWETMERGKVRSLKCSLEKFLPLAGVLWWEKPWSLAISLKMGCRLTRRWKWLMWCVMWLKQWIWEEVATSRRCNFLPTFCFLQLVNKIMSTNFPEVSDVVCNSV